MRTYIRKTLPAAVLGLMLLSQASADLSQQVDAIILQPGQSAVEFSVQIVKAETGEAVYKRNASTVLIPASNMKLIVTAAALKHLGADYEFKTTVALCGDTLVVIGGGDPLLGDRATDEKYGRAAGWLFDDIATALKQEGIREINDLIVDSSMFDDERVHPSWPKEQLNRWYACEVSGLNYNGNCIAVTTENTGGKVIVSIEPQTTFVKIINNVTATGGGRGAVGAYRTTEENKIILKGRCTARQGPFDVAIERPAAFFGFILAEHLLRAGIKTRGQIIEKTVDDSEGLEVLRRYTHPLSHCLARCNKDSFGLAAEALIKTIAAESSQTGKGGTWEKGGVLISAYLAGLGLDRTQFYVDDASGLSRENKLSANAITTVVLDVYNGKDWQLYRDSLAVGGVDGTVRRYFTQSKYRGRIRGKTGYITGVKTFSGVCSTEDGEYIFSILANNANGKTRTAINDIPEAIIDCSEAGNEPNADDADAS